ncbi:hypothetical protein G314FT_02310 [Vagococcus luciliae]|uniref:Amidohydrolase-related domain-containing protein n=1 Tax=Vagococcus luciliae TaxID=2920380 RepID=A0ABY5NWX5_9ENTE|nr:hypothetical protein [Vagococcus luciliae]UUV98140.1 hypothetical protein G314FT_02310 [Vagococcus luciliae]
MNYWLTNVLLDTNFIKEKDWVKGTQTELSAIHIIDGKIVDIIPQQELPLIIENNIIVANHQLLLPGLVGKHYHLGKSKLGTPWTPVTQAKNLVERFETEIPILDSLNKTISERANILYQLEVTNGVTSFRSHIDIEPATELRYFDAIVDLRKQVNIPY